MFNTVFPTFYPAIPGSADFRSNWDDFAVDETLPAMDLGAGEHVYLHIRKRGVNTDWLARQLAALLNIHPNDVGFCGLKDRHANTSQWFSLYLPKVKDLDAQTVLAQIEGDLCLLQQTRGNKKLRRGGHLSNQFTIYLRNFSGDSEALQERLEHIRHQGVPNYFGEQRFGIDNQNLQAGYSWLTQKVRIQRSLEGMYLSALRSYLFNSIVRARLAQAPLSDLQTLTGALWGRGRLPAEFAQFESEVLGDEALQPLLNALEHKGLNQERRALWLRPQDLVWSLPNPNEIRLCFSLAPGQYATSLLRECVQLRDASTKVHSV